MSSDDASLRRLNAALDGLADEDAAELVREARIEARARVRALLVEAMAERLLERTESSLGEPPPREVPQNEPPHRRSPSESSRVPSTSPPEDLSSDAPRREVETPGRAVPDHRDVTELGCYVYGIVPADSPVVGTAGIDPAHPLEIVEEGALGALTSRVPLDEFGEDALRERLEDVTWLERMARRHEEVLETVQREHATVVPMRLFTIYAGEGSVREMLIREREFLLDALERLAGRAEWGAKLFALPDGPELTDEEIEGEESIDEKLAETRPGESYLLRRRLADVRKEASSRLLQARSEETHAQLAALAVEARLNPLQPPELADHPGEMVLNGVYLVDASVSEDFLTLARQLQEEHSGGGLELVLTGPWPPYNFVNRSVEEGG
jgi:hypothetical protein